MKKFKLTIKKNSPTKLFRSWLDNAEALVTQANKSGEDELWIYSNLKGFKEHLSLGDNYRVSMHQSDPDVWHITLQYGQDGGANATIELQQGGEPTFGSVCETELSEG